MSTTTTHQYGAARDGGPIHIYDVDTKETLCDRGVVRVVYARTLVTTANVCRSCAKHPEAETVWETLTPPRLSFRI